MAASYDGDPTRGTDPGPGLLAALRRYPLVVIAGLVIGGVLGLGATAVLPNQFSATARVVIGNSNDRTVYRSVQPLNSAALAQNAAEAMRSPEVYGLASKLLNRRLTANQVKGAVTVAPADTSPQVSVTATRSHAASAADVANAVINAYEEISKNALQADANQAQRTLRKQQDQLEGQLSSVQDQQTARAKTIAANAPTGLTTGDRTKLIQSQLNSDAAYQSLVNQAARLSQTLADVRQTLVETKVDNQLTADGLDTVYLAAKPKSSLGADTRRNVAIGAILGLLLGMAVAWRLLDRRRGLESDRVAEALGAPLLGRIPRTRELKVPTRVIDLTPGRALADDLGVVATTVLLEARRRGLAGAVVTSAGPREGRTALATNLAAAARAQGEDVVLVDGDLRHPQLTASLDLAGHPGLRDLMGGTSQADYGQLAVGEANPTLPVLPVGAAAPSAARPGVPALGRADGTTPTAVIDAGPLNDDPFTLRLASGGAAGLVVVVSSRPTFEDLAALRARAELAGAPVLGFLVNDHTARKGRRPQVDASAYQGRRRVEDGAEASAPAVPSTAVSSASAPTPSPSTPGRRAAGPDATGSPAPSQ